MSSRDRLDSSLCRLCGLTEGEHRLLHPQPQHAFSVDGKLTVAKPPDSTVKRVSPPGDSVLRLLLIRSGVITVEQLLAIETELKATGLATSESSSESVPSPEFDAHSATS